MASRNPRHASGAERISQECISLALRALTRRVTATYDQALTEFGCSAAQLHILATIEWLGNDASAAEVGRHLHLQRSTLSRDVERLLIYGWIERSKLWGGRAMRLSLNATGASILYASQGAWKNAQSEVARLLGSALVQALRAVTLAHRTSAGRGPRRSADEE